MYAVEFRAKIKDGTIEVPAAYRDRLKGDVRVIILARDAEPEVDMIQQLINNPIHAPNFRPLTRDEIYNKLDE